MTLIRRTVGEFAENCYLYVDDATNRSVMIDPGGEPDTLVEMVRKSGSELGAIWLTHAHLDHIGGLEEVRLTYPVDVFMHPLDAPWYEQLSGEAARMYGVPWTQPTAPTRALADGDVLSCGDTQFSVMHLSGHAPARLHFSVITWRSAEICCSPEALAAPICRSAIRTTWTLHSHASPRFTPRPWCIRVTVRQRPSARKSKRTRS